MQHISVEEAKKRLANNEALCLVDVRELHEREVFNIGGIHCSIGKIQTMQIEALEDWKEEEVICYCRSGHRSMMAAMMLETLGFKNVKNLTGGMLAWGENV
ncbi:MAG TPA: rhodanese-like domain-containing protein [Chitinophagaceae bacterium]|nr:rhodanese-like domain-containing protein [Chitinophagaceae bacterium]